MSDRRTDTIDIGRGIQYAKVSARVAELHRDNTECSIKTSVEFKEGYALFSAEVTNKKGTFTGHALKKVSQQKDFEKLETIAVGRALAFAGYLSSGDIASQEEMRDFDRLQNGDTISSGDTASRILGTPQDGTQGTEAQHGREDDPTRKEASEGNGGAQDGQHAGVEDGGSRDALDVTVEAVREMLKMSSKVKNEAMWEQCRVELELAEVPTSHQIWAELRAAATPDETFTLES